jgi:hypothetical protein
MTIERFRVQGFKGSGFKGYNLVRIFQPGTLNGEPLNLGFNNIYEQAEKVSKLNSGLITYLLKKQKESNHGDRNNHNKPNELNELN